MKFLTLFLLLSLTSWAIPVTFISTDSSVVVDVYLQHSSSSLFVHLDVSTPVYTLDLAAVNYDFQYYRAGVNVVNGSFALSGKTLCTIELPASGAPYAYPYDLPLSSSSGGGSSDLISYLDEPTVLDAYLESFWWTIGLGMFCALAWYARSLGPSQNTPL